MITLLSHAALIILALITLLWIWSVFIKNVSIVDIFWGFGFVVVNVIYAYMSGELNARKILILTLVSIWGIRLVIYLAIRNIGKGEDFRYQEFRRNYGPKRYWWFSFFQTFLLQGVLIMIISLPLLGIHSSATSGDLNVLDYLGILVWIIGFTFETVGDFQLARFKKNIKNKGKVLNKGFWKYTRHPNYFGDSAVWWAYGIFSIAAGSYWQIIGSIIMTLLIIKISGVSLLEKTLKDTKPQYRDYIQKTNSFFPWFPKK
ncbi:MAG: steroid 5-alpha reductase family enzyme [Candidatus Azotimanducaceae bacterium]|jgi:steroid 5-alpha reductase family enzyme